MELIIDLRPTIKAASNLFFKNGNQFTIEEGEFRMLNEVMSSGKKLTDDELFKVKASFTDLIYAIVYYSVGNVFKSVDPENYRQPMYNFIEAHFINDNSALRKTLSRKVLSKLLDADTDSDLSRLVLANSNTSISECVGLFNVPVRDLTNRLHDTFARIPAYQMRTFDFRLNPSCDVLAIKLGEDVRQVLFRKLYPKGFYDGVELGTNGSPKHSDDFHEFNSYCVGPKEGYRD